MTGAMFGADSAALRAFAQQLMQAAVQLDRIRQSTRARLYTVDWQGRDGADYRRAWDAEHGPALATVAGALRASAQGLVGEGDQQDQASQAGAGGVGSGLRPLAGQDGGVVFPQPPSRFGGGLAVPGWMQDLGKVGLVLGSGAVTAFNRRAELVGQGMRVVDAVLENPRVASVMTAGKAVPHVGAPLEGLLGAHHQYHEDKNKGYGAAELTFRVGGAAVTAFGFAVGFDAAATAAGGAAGGAIASPGGPTAIPGAAIGAVVGPIFANVALIGVESQWKDEETGAGQITDELTDVGAAGGSRAFDMVPKTLDELSEAVRPRPIGHDFTRRLWGEP